MGREDSDGGADGVLQSLGCQRPQVGQGKIGNSIPTKIDADEGEESRIAGDGKNTPISGQGSSSPVAIDRQNDVANVQVVAGCGNERFRARE